MRPSPKIHFPWVIKEISTSRKEVRLKLVDRNITRDDENIDYFIKTYSNENETILDITCYNYLTGIRAKKLNRKYIGIDLEPIDMELD